MLLRTALLEGEEADRAWREARPAFDYEATSGEVQRILPLIYRTLADHGTNDPDLARFKGLYLRAWYQNQLRLKDLANALSLLRDAGTATLVLKGVPLAVGYYPELGLRPMADVDVLVPTEERDAALDVLIGGGWSLQPDERRRAIDHLHAIGVDHPAGGTLDLHWQMGMELVLRGDEARSTDTFWDAAVPFEVEGVSSSTLCATDMLLHVVVHGALWLSYAHLHWITDAMTIIRVAGPEIDWPRLVDHAQQRRVTLIVGDSLRYLTEAFDAPVPPDVLGQLDRTEVTRRDRIVHRARTEMPRPRRFVGNAPRAIAMHLHLTAHQSAPRAVAGLPRTYQALWQLDHTWQVPFRAVRAAARQLRRPAPHHGSGYAYPRSGTDGRTQNGGVGPGTGR